MHESVNFNIAASVVNGHKLIIVGLTGAILEDFETITDYTASFLKVNFIIIELFIETSYLD